MHSSYIWYVSICIIRVHDACIYNGFIQDACLHDPYCMYPRCIFVWSFTLMHVNVWSIYLWTSSLDPDACMYDARMYDIYLWSSFPDLDACIIHECMMHISMISVPDVCLMHRCMMRISFSLVLMHAWCVYPGAWVYDAYSCCCSSH